MVVATTREPLGANARLTRSSRLIRRSSAVGTSATLGSRTMTGQPEPGVFLGPDVL